MIQIALKVVLKTGPALAVGRARLLDGETRPAEPCRIGSTTGVTMAIQPIVERAGVPFISLAESAAIIDSVK
jgi:hypothetical protein